MNKQSALLLTALAIAIIGLTTYTQVQGNNLQVNKVPQTVPYVDIASFAGAWHEQAVIPYFWERGCTQTTAHYSLNKDGTIKVNNTCVINGKPKQAIGKAIIQDDTHAKLKVEFLQTLDIGEQYWVVRLAKDYSYTVTSTPDYKYLWIMYRQPVMPEVLYDEIYEDLKKDGFHVQKLVRTKQ